MKTISLTLICTMMFMIATLAQDSNSTSALQSMVATERAFAQASLDQGTRPAFLAYIAEDGILFRPTPVNGKKWLQENPLPASDKRPLLAWQPVFADIAISGDLGYTFGPWEFKPDIKDEKPAAYGHFATVWKKQSDGSWKFVIDHGISHPEAAIDIKPWKLPADYQAKTWEPSKFNLASERQDLFAHDRKFAKASAERGLIKAFLDYADSEARLFRNGHYPFVGTDGIRQALAKTPAEALVTWEPSNGDLATSADLGYTYGSYTIVSKAKPQTIIKRGNYVRIWKKRSGIWKLALDVEDVVAAEDKK